MSNGCPVCLGLGRVLALGASGRSFPVLCPECAGLAVTPASAEDHRPSVPDEERRPADGELRQAGSTEPTKDQQSSFSRSTSWRNRP